MGAIKDIIEVFKALGNPEVATEAGENKVKLSTELREALRDLDIKAEKLEKGGVQLTTNEGTIKINEKKLQPIKRKKDNKEVKPEEKGPER